MILTGSPLPYDLYVNASSVQGHEKFVKIFPKNDMLSPQDLERLKQKYFQLYIAECARGDFLKSVCSHSGKNLEEKGAVLKDSAIQYLDTLFNPDHQFTTEVLGQTIEGCKDVVANMVDVMHNQDIDAIREMIAKLSFHDFYTFDHSINVAMYSIMLMQHLHPNATRDQVIEAGLGGLLHDLGKIKIPTHIINKPGKLTDEEFKQIKSHPEFGRELMMQDKLILPTGLDPILLARTIHEHHENFDGTGYPCKVVGKNIYENARITAIADFFDAITTKRSYHAPLSVSEALSLMKKSSGTKLDPELFETFSKNTSEFKPGLNSNFTLSQDFDPCQPCNELPLGAALNLRKPGFGGIKIVGSKESLKDWATKENVRVIDPLPHKKKTGT